ncbi:MAG TPA: dolichyl-phosphate beta-glucosyltransferase [Vicinamibacteria bacterium]|nr:dolichyl-phosphate beta-glucosyltransferase [Vicinamibacteria bacterium]
MTPRLSVVIPAFNEERRLPESIARVRAFLEARGQSFEIVVADDGSQDATAAVAEASGGPATRVLRGERNRGKGHAVRRGMRAARGERRLMTDADLSAPIEELVRLEERLDQGYDVAIGSRAVQGARIEVRQGRFRETAGRAFNVLVRLLLLPRIRDTQCGFKLFTARAAEVVFEKVRLDGFSFDVEALYVARRAGLQVAEVPVVWRNDAATRVGGLSGARAFLDLARIRLNGVRGRYGPAL